MLRTLLFVQTQNRRNSNCNSHFYWRKMKYLLSQATQKGQIPSGEIPGKSEFRMQNPFVNKMRMKMISSVLATESKLEFLKQIFFFVTSPFHYFRVNNSWPFPDFYCFSVSEEICVLFERNFSWFFPSGGLWAPLEEDRAQALANNQSTPINFNL